MTEYAKIRGPEFVGKITGIDRVLATLVLQTARIREESYNKTAADRYTEISREKERLVRDYAQFYTLSLSETATEVCKGHANLGMPVYLLLATAWNDALEWAESVVGPVSHLDKSKE